MSLLFIQYCSVSFLQIGDKIVVLNRIREDQTCPIVYYPKNSWVNRRNPQEDSKSARIDLASREQDRDENVNGRRGVLRNHKREADDDEVYQPGCSYNSRGDILVQLLLFKLSVYCFIFYVFRLITGRHL